MENTQDENADDPLASRTFRGSRYDFVVLSRTRIQTAVIDRRYIVISVGDPGDADAQIPDSPNCRAILRLQFDDIDPERRSLRNGAAMTAEDARAILEFVRQHVQPGDDEAGVRTIVCQCGLGISRSAAIAAALSRRLQAEDGFFFSRFSPNYHVYRTLMNVKYHGLSESESAAETSRLQASRRPYPFTDKDFLPADRFALFPMTGHWTEEKFNVLPADVLSKIRPFTEWKAQEIAHYRRYLAASTPEHRFEVSKVMFTKIQRVDTSGVDAEPIRVWLGKRQISPDTLVIVSWDSRTAVQVSWDVFCRYWDDFCYPGSDEVAVWPESEDWALVYWHEEWFSFGTRLSENDDAL